MRGEVVLRKSPRKYCGMLDARTGPAQTCDIHHPISVCLVLFFGFRAAAADPTVIHIYYIRIRMKHDQSSAEIKLSVPAGRKQLRKAMMMARARKMQAVMMEALSLNGGTRGRSQC